MTETIHFTARPGELAGLEADVGIVYRLRGEPGIVGPVGADLAKRLLDVAREDHFIGRSGRLLLWHASENARFG